MTGRSLIPLALIGLVLIMVLILLVIPADMMYPAQTTQHTTVNLLYASSGSMSQLLNTGQIDAFIVWESVVSTTTLSGTGKMIATAETIPPPGEWGNAACCVLVLRNDLLEKNPDIAALLSGLTTAAVDWVNENPDQAENITAEWVFGTAPILTPGGSLVPASIEQQAFKNIVFTSDAPLPDPDSMNTQDGTAPSPGVKVNATVAEQGRRYLDGTLPLPDYGDKFTISLDIGYLPSSDHNAPLYAMVIDSEYFCDRYGFCLMPATMAGRESNAVLVVGNQAVAAVTLVPGQSGGGIMTTIGQEALDGAYIGSVPAALQIDLGNPASVIQSINTGGTGLVVSPEAPCDDWKGFIEWAGSRSAQGRPLVIATVQSSIQEEMIRSAFSYENITVEMYGVHI